MNARKFEKFPIMNQVFSASSHRIVTSLTYKRLIAHQRLLKPDSISY